MAKQRQSNIELLRILAILGVILLHYNNDSSGGGFRFVEPGSLNQGILFLIECCAVCAVDLFVLVSGYFLSKTEKRDPWKAVELVVQVILFRLGIYVLSSLNNPGSFTVKELVVQLLPVNYFVVLYVALYFVSPYLNLLFRALSWKQKRRFVILISILFLAIPTAVDILKQVLDRSLSGLSPIGLYGSQDGYTIVNFAVMYLLGAWLRDSEKTIPTGKGMVALAGVVGFLFAWSYGGQLVNPAFRECAWAYCNPLVAAEAVLLFLLFRNLNIGTVGWINKLAESTFTVFLTHGLLISRIRIESFVRGNPLLMLAHMILSAAAIFFCGWVVHLGYHAVTAPVFRFLKKRVTLPPICLDEQ